MEPNEEKQGIAWDKVLAVVWGGLGIAGVLLIAVLYFYHNKIFPFNLTN
ncbi:MAG: hypothetical protein GY754_29310 [bacterium]|nr:hypothetical protein [bacterium]